MKGFNGSSKYESISLYSLSSSVLLSPMSLLPSFLGLKRVSAHWDSLVLFPSTHIIALDVCRQGMCCTFLCSTLSHVSPSSFLGLKRVSAHWDSLVLFPSMYNRVRCVQVRYVLYFTLPYLASWCRGGSECFSRIR